MKPPLAFLFTLAIALQAYAQNPGEKSITPRDSAAAMVDQRYGKAQQNMATFKTPDGLHATLFAAEPMIQNPTNIDIDPRGRVWAIEAVNYRSSFQKWGILRPAGDRVVILEDTNGDGLADKETTFWQTPELKAPLGICVLPQPRGTQVIVSAAPNVWLLTDTDGDDAADKVVKLFTVGGNWDHDHEVHAFTFGSDGKFYFNFGNESQTLKDADGKVITDLAGNEITNKGKPYRQGMVFRCDIVDGKPANVETLAWNFRNNYEVCVDSFGTLWQSDNDDDGNKGVRVNYVMEDGNYGYTDEMTGAGWGSKRTNLEPEIPLRHWHLNDPGVVPNLLQTGGGSPTGILLNEGTGLGPRFANQIIHCDAGPRVVRAYPVENDGAGYKASVVNVLTSSDDWYRPSDVAIAPDGALFVADWYDPGVGGHNMGDHVQGKIMGRIYRVSSSATVADPPKLDLSSISGAIAALVSPNRATQYAAWNSLHQADARAESELLKLWKNENPRFRARALGLLTQIKGSENKYLAEGLSDTDANVRICAVRLSKMLATSRGLDTTPLEENRDLITRLIHDPSPQVRRQIAVSLANSKDGATLWTPLALQYDGKDRWYLEALGIGARGNDDACFDAWLAAVGDKWNTPAGRDIIWRLRSAKAASFLSKILQDESLSDVEKPRFLRAFDFLPETPEKTESLVQLASLGKESELLAVEALQRLKNSPAKNSPAVKAALESMLAATKGTARFVDLVRDFQVKGQGASLLEFIAKAPSSPEAIEATKVMLQTDQGALVAALAQPNALPVIQALGNTSEQGAVTLLDPLLMDAKATPEIRKAAVKALAQSQTGIAALVSKARNGQFPEELKFSATVALAAVQQARFKNDIAELFPPPSAAGGQALPPLPELIKRSGDAARGKAVFEKVESTCVTCHRAGNVGADVGPALSEIGSKLGKEALYESIIAPNAGISMGFETTQLALKNGDAALGIVRSETPEEIILVMPGGIQNRYNKTDIAKREKLPTSLMPSGVQAVLPRQDLIDLVEYLASLKKQ